MPSKRRCQAFCVNGWSVTAIVGPSYTDYSQAKDRALRGRNPSVALAAGIGRGRAARRTALSAYPGV